MNASPYFRYYAALVLILVLVLLLRVQAHPDQAAPTAQMVEPSLPIAHQSIR